MLSRIVAAVGFVLFGVNQIAAGQTANPEPKAFLRAGADGYYVALILDPPAAPNTPPNQVIASLYRSGRMITQTVREGDQHGAAFTMPLGGPGTFGGNARGLLVAVSSYPTTTDRPGAFAARSHSKCRPQWRPISVAVRQS